MLIQVDDKQVTETIRKHVHNLVAEATNSDTNRQSISLILTGMEVGVLYSLGFDSESYRVVTAASLKIRELENH